MEHSYQIVVEDNCVVNTIRGELTFEDYRQLMTDIMNDEDFISSMNMFWDFRGGTLGKMSFDDFKGVKSFVQDARKQRGTGYRVVFLVDGQLDYGLSRMYQTLSDELPVEFEIFYDEESAYDWINEKLP